MADTITEMIGDVYTIKGITGSRQLIEFYKEVVKGNYEKYVAITKENIRYGYDSDKQKPVRLDTEYAINPNYRPIEIKREEIVEPTVEPVIEEVVQPEVVVEEPVQVIAEVTTEPEIVIPEVVEENVVVSEVVNYEQLYVEAKDIIKQLESDVALHKERADVAEHDNATLREMKVVNEGRIEEFKAELERKVTELTNVIAENNELKEAIKNNSAYTELDTDTLIAHLVNKGYKVSITR